MVCQMISLQLKVLLLSLGSSMLVSADQSFPSPVGIWMLNGQTGGTDLSGNGNDAVLSNTVQVTGPFGTPDNAVSFTGATDSKAVIPNTNRALSVTRSMTWIAYVKDMEANGEGPLFSMGPSSDWGMIIRNCCPNGGSLHYSASHGISAPIEVTDIFSEDEWIRVALVYDYDLGQMKVYKNDEELVDESSVYSGELDDEHDEVNVAVYPGDSRTWKGALYCMMYFGAALTREQLSAAFSICRTNELQALYPWPYAVAHWPMNTYHGINNAAGGLHKDGTAHYYSVEKGPTGEAGGSFSFRDSPESYATIENIDNRLDVNSFTFSAWIKPTPGTRVIFRIWGDTDMTDQSITIEQSGDGTQISYTHYSADDGLSKGTVQTISAALALNRWNSMAVTYNYGEGKSYIYTNGELRIEGSHGSHVTKMGPMFALLDDSTSVSGGLSASLACVQWFNFPISSFSHVSDHCEQVQETYKSEPAFIFPFNKAYGLADMTRRKRLAISSVEPAYTTGYRQRPSEALVLSTGQTISLPELVDPSIDVQNVQSWTFSVNFKIGYAVELHFFNSGFKILGHSLKSELLGIWWGLQNTTGMYNEADSTWFAVVYDGYRSVLTMYQDGNPLRTQYVTGYAADLQFMNITNAGAETAIQCFQLYTEVLDLSQLSKARDACIEYTTEASLPYPRGLWPLNYHYGLKDITGRAGDFQAPPGQGQVATFEDSGPLGDQRGSLNFPGTGNLTSLFIPPSPALDIKLSMTLCGWIMVHDSFENGTYTYMMTWKFQYATEYSDRGDTTHTGLYVAISRQADGLLRVVFGSTKTLTLVTEPETNEQVAPEVSDELQVGRWAHLAVTSDFHRKTFYFYLNGKLRYTVRLNRYIIKTFYSAQVGIQLVFDDDDMVANGHADNERADHNIACYQLYDVALNEKQVQRTMNLCSPQVLGSIYYKPASVPAGHSIDGAGGVFYSGSRPQCLLKCSNSYEYDSAAFGVDGVCDCDSRTAAEETATLTATNRDYKQKSPSNLFV